MIMEHFIDRKIPRPVESHLSEIMKPLLKLRMNEKSVGWCSWYVFPLTSCALREFFTPKL